MNKFIRVDIWLLIVFLFSCRSLPVDHSKKWQEDSQKIVDSYAHDLARFYPETVSDIGYDEYEGMITPYGAGLDRRYEKFLNDWKNRLSDRPFQSIHPELKTDVKILVNEVNLELEGLSFEKTHGIVPFFGFSEYVYQNLKDLFSERGSEGSRKKGLLRFKRYVRGDSKILPLDQGIRDYINERLVPFQNFPEKAFWPTKYEVETYLENSNKYISAVKDLLSHFNEKEWKNDFQRFKQQDLSFQNYIKEKFLPYARSDNKTPIAIFEFKLKKIGVDTDVDELISIAKRDYAKTYADFQEKGNFLAKKYKLKDSRPKSVIHFFSKKSLRSQEQLLEAYKNKNNELFNLVKEKDLITIKNAPKFIIRFANPAESQSTPAPFFISPPLLDKKNVSPGQFVITPPTEERNDFSYPEAILTLTAHETMPGHGLQYHSMKERGTTLIRSWLAFNNVNVEGWGLYAEDIIYPFVSEEEKFVLLQRRLWRQARMFLDPELNLGRIKKERVFDVFEKELGFSRPFSQSEFDRYFYIMPGQATSYYYGYRKLIDLKKNLKLKLLTKFTEKCFNDAVLNLGVLPLKEIHDRLMSSLDCNDSESLAPQ